MKTKKELIWEAVDYMHEYPQQRYGQALFKVCHKYYPERCDELRATEYDCFAISARADLFLEKLLGEDDV